MGAIGTIFSKTHPSKIFIRDPPGTLVTRKVCASKPPNSFNKFIGINPKELARRYRPTYKKVNLILIVENLVTY